MFGPLIDVWMAHERGEPAERRPAREGPPPHLQGVAWTYGCECGLGWHTTADAIWHHGSWQGPAIECVGCHRWVPGRQ